MNFGCIALPLVPGRREPSDKSEMITQLLFGERYEILQLQKKWVLIKILSDQYECWIDRKQHNEDQNDFDLDTVVRSTLQSIQCSSEIWQLPAGAKIRRGKFSIGNKNFQFDHEVSDTPSKPAEFARRFLGAPYLWGGKSVLGIDCSGLVQVVYSCCGIQLPRDAYQQAEIGETIDFVETALPGDLAFFDNEEGNITHVGILIDGEHIVHASGHVRIDRIDHQGIFNSDIQEYSHRLRIVKRISS
ncbi:MAG: C40 family peptidase [Flavobacteriales bacterium]|nr:C40 family peptidase [Flavobacteriales bacterium]